MKHENVSLAQLIRALKQLRLDFFLEDWQSGRSHLSWKQEAVTGPEVRILHLPPKKICTAIKFLCSPFRTCSLRVRTSVGNNWRCWFESSLIGYKPIISCLMFLVLNSQLQEHLLYWGIGTAATAPALQAGFHEFESRIFHHCLWLHQ